MLSSLPTPLELGALAGLCTVAAVACLWLTSSVKLCMYLGAAAFVLGLCASVAFGYEKMGEAKIQPQLDAAIANINHANAVAAQFQVAESAANAKAAAAIKARNAALAQLHTNVEAQINAQAAAVRDAPVNPAVVSLLNGAISQSRDGNSPAGPGVDGSTAPVTVGDWEHWSGVAIDYYGHCLAVANGLQDYINGLVAASPAAP